MQPMQEQPKNITHGKAAQEQLLAGARIIYQAVSSTLGPRSSNVAIRRPYGAPAVIHDGKNVARACLPLADPEQDTGAEILYQAAEKTDSIGDGTTTATILGFEIFQDAHKLITAKARTMALREGIELATEAVLQELDKLAKPIDARGKKKEEVSKEVLMIATISAQNPDIGQMVADAYAQLGSDGILTVEESRTADSFLELKQGMQFDKGWVSPYFITPGNQLEESVVDNAYILVTDHHLRNLDEFVKMMVVLVDEQKVKDLVIIADRIEPQVLAFFLKNQVKGTIRGNMITAPSFGEKRIDILKDIAIMTGAAFVSESAGVGLQSVTKEMLGRAKRVTSTRDTTLIIDGKGSAEDIAARVEEVRAKSENSDLSAFDREKLLERLARMHSGVGVLTIGAKSEPELKERRERAVDAISAAKAALSEGIVPGGGMALITAARAAEKRLEDDLKDVEVDVRSGARIVFDACYAPFRKLMSNSGYDAGQMLARLEGQKAGFGVDVMDGQIVEMIEAGIIDPVAVVRAALGNASSAAVMLATSDTVITEKPIATKED